MKYTKKPVQVDAWNIGDLIETAKRDQLELPIEVQNGCMDFTLNFLDHAIIVRTISGSMPGLVNEYLVFDEHKEFYTTDSKFFDRIYQPYQPSETQTLAAKIEVFENSIKPYVLESVHLDTTHSPKVSFQLRSNGVWDASLRLSRFAGIPSEVLGQYAMDASALTLLEALEQLEIKCRQDPEFVTLLKPEDQS